MAATAHRDFDEFGAPGFDPATLAHDLAALRQQLRSLASDLHTSQRENAALRHELDRVRTREAAPPPPAARRPMPEVQRFKQELEDQLARLRRVAAARTVDADEPAPAPAPTREARGGDAWMRRMMLCVMMSELM
jgi:hypothetical protein